MCYRLRLTACFHGDERQASGSETELEVDMERYDSQCKDFVTDVMHRSPAYENEEATECQAIAVTLALEQAEVEWTYSSTCGCRWSGLGETYIC